MQGHLPSPQLSQQWTSPPLSCSLTVCGFKPLTQSQAPGGQQPCVCVCVCVCVLAGQSCPILCDPMDCSLPGSSIHGILQARLLEWVAISFSRGSSQPRNKTWVSCISGKFFYHLSHQGSPESMLSSNSSLYPQNLAWCLK